MAVRIEKNTEKENKKKSQERKEPLPTNWSWGPLPFDVR
jgi:hypothetical protein